MTVGITTLGITTIVKAPLNIMTHGIMTLGLMPLSITIFDITTSGMTVLSKISTLRIVRAWAIAVFISFILKVIRKMAISSTANKARAIKK
jgi:hypothetical protein